MTHRWPKATHDRWSRTRTLAIALAVVLVLPTWTALRAAEAQSFDVVIGASVQPAELTVPVGASVTWRNEDAARHRMRSQSGPAEFDSGNLEAGESFTHTFDIEGTYAYIDARNQDASQYFGRIIVSNGAPGGGGGTAAGTAAPADNSATVNMAGRRFSPSTVTIAVGGTVTFNNNDGDQHTASARDRSFDSGTLNGGARFEHTFDTAGRFAFICAFHSDMTGEIVVTDASGATPTPSPVPSPTLTPTLAPGTSAGTAGGPVTASIIDFDFAPQTVTVQAGRSVTWRNDGIAPHTVTANDGSFDSGMMSGGQAYTRSFETPGRFPFFCAVHPNMVGEVVVTNASGQAPTAAAAAPPPPSTPGANSSPPPSSSSTAGASRALAAGIIDFDFVPKTVTVQAGQPVTWTNDGVAPHTITATDGSFDSGWISGGEVATLTFTEVGDFPFYCTLHPNMVGTISVVEPEDSTAATALGATAGGDGSTEPSSAAGAVAPAVEGDPQAQGADGSGTAGLSIALLTVILLLVAAIGVAIGFMAHRLEGSSGASADGASR